jgi:hypothetical protein
MDKNEFDEIELPTNILCSGITIESLINDIYGDILDEKNYNQLYKYAILAPRNREVSNINNLIISK